MSWDVWGPPIIVLLLGVVAGLVVALRARGAAVPVASGDRAALLARKEMLLEQIRAMEADKDKLNADEFRLRREALLVEATWVERALAEPAAPAAAAPAPAPGRAGARAAWAAGVIAFFILLGVGITEFSKPRGAGQGMTGGGGNMEGGAPPTAAAPPLSAEVQAAQATLAADPRNLEALNLVTYDALLRGDLDLAMQSLEPAREIAPEDPSVLIHLAMLQLAVGMVDRAMPALEAAVRARPDWGRPQLWMGLALLQGGQNEAGIASLDKAISLGLNADELGFARQLRAQAMLPPAAASAPPPAAAPPAEAGPPRLAGKLRLADGVAARPDQLVFVIVHRNADGSGPPVAAKRLPASALPVDFSLGDADQMMGGTWPEQVWLFARLDADGAPGSSDGDVESAHLGPLAPGSLALDLVIGGG